MQKYKFPAILLILLISCVFVVYLLVSNLNNKPAVVSDADTTPASNFTIEDEERKDLTLNFKSTQVVISGYPYANSDDADYIYKLFTIVYIGSFNSEAQFISKYYETSDDWTGSYFSSMEKDEILLAMSKSIWHKMELVKLADIGKEILDCTVQDVTLVDGYSAKSYSCPNASNLCFMTIDEEVGLLYSPYKSDTETKDMCEIIEENAISGITLKGY